MIVICAWHKPEPITIGEKCPSPACGQLAMRLPILGLACCTNPDCSQFLFPIGEGGTTHSICPNCADDLMSARPAADCLAPDMLHDLATGLQDEFDRLERRA